MSQDARWVTRFETLIHIGTMETAVLVITGLAVLCIFLDAKLVGADSSKSQDRFRLDTLHYVRNVIFGLAAWIWLTILSVTSLSFLIFRDQSDNLLSGTPITVFPAIFWGLLIGWLASGKRIAAEGDGGLSTTEQRVDRLFVWIEWLVSKSVRITVWIVAGGVLLILLVWLGSSFDYRVSSMAPSEAIIIGAIIIAWAVWANRK